MMNMSSITSSSNAGPSSPNSADEEEKFESRIIRHIQYLEDLVGTRGNWFEYLQELDNMMAKSNQTLLKKVFQEDDYLAFFTILSIYRKHNDWENIRRWWSVFQTLLEGNVVPHDVFEGSGFYSLIGIDLGLDKESPHPILRWIPEHYVEQTRHLMSSASSEGLMAKPKSKLPVQRITTEDECNDYCDPHLMCTTSKTFRRLLLRHDKKVHPETRIKM